MTIRSLAARGLSFAHLAGLTARARAEGDEPEDEDKKDARRAEDDEPEEQDRDDKDSKKGKRASEADDEDAEDDDKKDDTAKKGKKAKAAEEEKDEDDERADDEDDDDEEMRGKSADARARRREQARCASIMGSKAAGRNVELAANLAFKTRMTRQEALAILQSTPAATAPSQGRSARNPSLGAGGEVQGNSRQAAAAGWDRAFAKVSRSGRK